MKLTDYVVQFLAEKGVHHVFGLSGGAIVHFFDSAARSGKLKPIFNHHEQAGAFAAQAYARANNTLGACFATTGPGATNTVTGLAAAWLDSVPCVFISGQTRLAHTTRGKKIRQVGTQQLDVIPIVKSMTKYAVMLEDANMIRYHLEKAYHLATTGRPGPVWIDVPLDLQWANIDPAQCKAFDPQELGTPAPQGVRPESLRDFHSLLSKAKRPLVLAGYGVRRAHAENEFEQFLKRYQLPYVTTWGAVDLLPTADPLYMGRPGVVGQRGANLAVQNCDLLICLGSHLCIPVTGTMFDAFAREAKIVMVDIDQDELEDRTVPIHLPVHADVRDFLSKVLSEGKVKRDESALAPWSDVCGKYKELNATPKTEPGAKWINPYESTKIISDTCKEGDIIVVDGGGTNIYISYQTYELKKNQRMLLSTALCSMGSGLPEAIGACLGSGGQRTLCMNGDGSLQLNIQELQTIKHHKLPIKIFVLNNDGYVSIRATQSEFLEGNFVGSSSEGGMTLPDYIEVAKAYGIPALRITRAEDLKAGIQKAMDHDGAFLCEIVTNPKQELNPRQGFDRKPDGSFRPRPLEDMAPFLDRDEFRQLMLTRPWDSEGTKSAPTSEPGS